MEITKAQKIARKSLYDKGYKYLYDNFHKFNQAQKIKVALEVIKMEYDSKREAQEHLNAMPPLQITLQVDNAVSVESKTQPEPSIQRW